MYVMCMSVGETEVWRDCRFIMDRIHLLQLKHQLESIEFT